MRKFMFASLMLGLPIIGSSLTNSAPAHATVWKNLATIRAGSDKCLGVANGQNNKNLGQPLIIWHCDSTPNQDWVESTFTPEPTASWFFTTVGTSLGAPRMVVMGVSGGVMTSGRSVVDWTQTNDLNQGWSKGFSVQDPRGHDCFIFFNSASPRRPPANFALSVQNFRIDAGAPVVIEGAAFSSDIRPDQYWCRY